MILSEGRNRTKARVRLVTWHGQPAVEKDYTGRWFPVRHFLGPFFLNREQQALERLAGTDGVPAFRERPARDRLVMERIDGVPLKAFVATENLAPGFFPRLQELVEELHRKGVAQCDIGTGDVLVRPDGSPGLVDFSVSVRERNGRFGRWLFETASTQDRRRIARLHQRYGPEDLTGFETELVAREPALTRGLRLFRHLFSGRRPATRTVPGLLRLFGLFLFLAGLALVAQPDPVDFWLGLPLVLAGAAVRGWAAGHLLKTAELATGGPYAHTRNPLYLGRLLLLTGLILMARLPFRANLGVLVFFWGLFFFYYLPRKERVEGDRLLRRHGERYRQYAATVPALLPRLRSYRDADGSTAAGWRLDCFLRNREYLMLLLEIVLVGLFATRAFL